MAKSEERRRRRSSKEMVVSGLRSVVLKATPGAASGNLLEM